MIIGIGIDLIEVSRIKAMIRRYGEKFLSRVFTPQEREYSLRSVRSAEHFAARFAAKEAVMKALGTGLSQGIAWTDVEVGHDNSGRPIVILHHQAARVAQQQHIVGVRLSLTHIKSAAGAVAIAEGGAAERARTGLVKRERTQPPSVAPPQAHETQPETPKKPRLKRDNPGRRSTQRRPRPRG
jgi:holo-[acyl-carrier protein] synthase